MKPTISVILPNYNGHHLLASNLPSLILSLKAAECDYEIIVVDDCSSDDSIHMLHTHFPEVITLRNEVNKGFSATCNRGIFSAKYSLLCIVNTDVSFTIDYFINAIPHFQNTNLFAVKGNIINYKKDFNDVVNVEKTSLLYYKRGFLRFNQRIKNISGTFSAKVNEQFVLLGCAFICDRKKMLLLDGFDEIFSPFYWEDADLALRALHKGYDLVYEPECIVYHQTSSTISNYRSNTKRRLVSMRNKFIFTWRHLEGKHFWRSHIFHLFISLLSRWIIFDWKYYIAFLNALIRQKTFN
jgi:GT2 family glycosyltransferase